MRTNLFFLSLLGLGIMAAMPVRADKVAQFDMTLHNGRIEENISGQTFEVLGNFAPENVAGVVGQALRFDGYTSHVKASLGQVLPRQTASATVSMWVAMPSYPIIQLDTDTPVQTPVISCLNTEEKTGFGLYLGSDGKYSFRTYIQGWPVNIAVATPLPTYQWCCLTAVLDENTHTLTLYNNGEQVGSARANGTLSFSPCDLYMGQGKETNMNGPFELMSYNGLIDEITIWNTPLPLTQIQEWKTSKAPDLDIPASRFESDLLRPRFHAMPAAAWTNECHGMYFSDGRYHLFFQKNADGPYMARLHWGHLSSADLCHWREERIALAPCNWYDVKGCWSGCIFSDPIITDDKPSIIYTAVNYSKAMIAQATPLTDNLDIWTKNPANPIIASRPNGLSDDFRDPYFFRTDKDAYMIVGTSVQGTGATTLHKYMPNSGTWTNTGDIFFQGATAATDGKFWEMPTITRMPSGQWLFTATPLSTAQGVKTLYWTGSIGADGTFQPSASSALPHQVEMCAGKGFGLLSPTIYNKDNRTIALGIVPDKLPASTNWRLGWAHCYSLPRQWSIGTDGSLVQRPADELKALRTAQLYHQQAITLDGTVQLTTHEGRSAEALGNFIVGSNPFGFKVLAQDQAAGIITYNPDNGQLVVDFSTLPRLDNDSGDFDGIYSCTLPEKPAVGSELTLQVFIDHSILDIFVNNRWATSIRVFPTSTEPMALEAFSQGRTQVTSLDVWILNGGEEGTSIPKIAHDTPSVHRDIYNIQGVKVKQKATNDQAESCLPVGVYIMNGKKILVR